MKKISIMFLTIQLETIGGSENLIYNLIKKLDHRKYDIHLGWLSLDNILQKFDSLPVKKHFIPKKEGFDVMTIKSIVRIIKEHNIDVVNAHHFMPFFYAFIATKLHGKSKIVFTAHSQWEFYEMNRLWHAASKALFKTSEKIVGISPEITEMICKNYRPAPKRIETIINGIDIRKYNNFKDRANIRKGLGIDEDSFVIGTVANFRKIKNHIFLLRAFREVYRRAGSTRLVIVGEGYDDDLENSEAAVKEYIERHNLQNAVMLLGYRSDVNEVLLAMDLFCLTSKEEGLPLSLIEAMASGLPVIGTNVKGIKGIIEDGVSGLLVELDDIEQLEKSITMLMHDATLRNRLALNSIKLAKSRYSLDHCVEKYHKVFNELVFAS